MNYESEADNNLIYDNINRINDNKYRKELIIAKVIISELQDSIDTLKKEKNELELKLEETLNNLKFIHSDYISLTKKLDDMNKTVITDSNNIEKNYENKIKTLKLKNDELAEELKTKKEINKLQEEALERKISLLEKKLEKTEEELIDTKKKCKININLEKNKNIIDKENLELREDNIKMSLKFNEEIKNISKDLENCKLLVKKLENENFLIKKDLNEKNEIIEKEQKMNMEQDKINKYLNNMKLKSGDLENIKKQYNMLLKEKNELDKKYQLIITKTKSSSYMEELEIVKEQNKYILNLLLKITPNPSLIKQIVELNKEIILLERKKIPIINDRNKNRKINDVVLKIDENINKFKNNLYSLENELINADFGSSVSNNENSLNISN